MPPPLTPFTVESGPRGPARVGNAPPNISQRAPRGHYEDDSEKECMRKSFSLLQAIHSLKHFKGSRIVGDVRGNRQIVLPHMDIWLAST